MPDAPYADTYHRWQWFRRRQWWPSVRDRMLAARGRECGALLSLLGGPAGRRVLDATCGLGRRSLVLGHLGAVVTGTDACAYAVERARELAAGEGMAVEFRVAAWRELPAHLPDRFDAAVADAFSDCCEPHDDLVASFAGVAGALKPGGLFLFPGPTPGEGPAAILEGAWQCGPQFAIGWQHAEEGLECTCLHARSRGDGFIDEHDLHLIREPDGEVRLETATTRRWLHWRWEDVDDAARAAGFATIEAREFPGYGWNGTSLTRLVAALP